MNPNPFSDVVAFVTNPVWTTAVFWLLVLASVLIAAAVWQRFPEQRRFPNLAQWSFRFVIGALQILNLWLGLYSAPGEWPWTYFFLLLLQLMFAVHCYGRSLGVDAILIAGRGSRSETGIIRRLLAAAI